MAYPAFQLPDSEFPGERLGHPPPKRVFLCSAFVCLDPGITVQGPPASHSCFQPPVMQSPFSKPPWYQTVTFQASMCPGLGPPLPPQSLLEFFRPADPQLFP